MPLDEAIDAEARASGGAWRANDFRRAYEAFVEKRAAASSKATDGRARSAWPFFDEEHRAFAAGSKDWLAGAKRASTTNGRRSASCRAWVRGLGEAGWLRARACRPLWRTCAPSSTCARFASRARRSPYALGARRFRLRDAGPRQRADQRSSAAPSCSARYLPRRRGRSAASPPSRSPEREAGSDVAALATRRAARRRRVRPRRREELDLERRHRGPLRRLRAHRRRGREGLSAFAVDASTPGCSAERTRSKTISPHPLGTLRFEGARVPARCRIGDEGEGFKIAMATLDVFRSTVGAAALGFARRAFDETVGAREVAQALRRAARRRCSSRKRDCGDGDRRRRERAARLSSGVDEGFRRARA